MKRKLKIIILVVWVLAVMLVMSMSFFSKHTKDASNHHINKIDIWTYRGEDREKPVLLPVSIKEDQVEIYTILPENFDIRQTICFWTRFHDVEVFLDDELIYKTEEDHHLGKTMVAQWNYIDIPEEMAGHELTIKLTSPYKIYKIFLEKVVYGSTQDIQKWMYNSFGIIQLMDWLLIIGGILFILFAIFRNLEKRYRMCHIYFGITAILFGISMRLGMQGIPQYWINEGNAAMLAYFAQFLIPIPLTIYVKLRVHRVPIFVNISSALLGLEGLNILVAFGMHGFGIRDIQGNLWLGQLWILISVCWAVFVAVSYYIKRRKSISILTVANGFILVFVVLAGWINAELLFDVAYVELIIRICTLTIIVFEFVMLFLHIKEKEKAQKRIKEDNKNLQLQVLTGQIRPHFILNTLGAIRSLLPEDANRASDLLYDFSKYIRKNMEQKDYSKPIPFLEELDYIQTYLKLEKLRFDEKLKVEYNIEETGFWILPLTIQPFVENAVKHGLLEKKQGGTVSISSYKDREKIIIKIQDDGVGFDTKEFWQGFENRKSVGMRSAIIRLENEMKAECQIESSMQEECSGTCIKIILPQKRGISK